MGRGRAKAKQTRVARKLKYYSPDTDLSALERELRSQTDAGGDEATDNGEVDEENGGEDYGGWAPGQR